jgi:hypothetical protein
VLHTGEIVAGGVEAGRLAFVADAVAFAGAVFVLPHGVVVSTVAAAAAVGVCGAWSAGPFVGVVDVAAVDVSVVGSVVVAEAPVVGIAVAVVAGVAAGAGAVRQRLSFVGGRRVVGLSFGILVFRGQMRSPTCVPA